MSWRDDFSDTGKFRGVPFFVRTHSVEGGRRNVRNEYPLRDLPSVQDLGRKARTWQVELYVIGPDYHLARDQLTDALEAGGAGELVHPWHGTLRVNVDSYRLEESTERGGTARFSVTFVESGEVLEPRAVQDTRNATAAAVAACEIVMAAEVAASLNTDGMPAWADEGLREKLLRGIAGLRGEWADALENVRDAAAIAEKSFGAARGIAAQARSGFGLVALVNRVRALGDLISPDVATTPTMARLAQNQAVVARTVRVALIAAAAGQSATLSYSSQQEARAMRTAITLLINEEFERVDAAGKPVSGPLYVALVEVRSSVAKDMAVRGLRLPEITQYTPAATLPALVIAQRLYGDASRAAEIVQRNRIADPGFVPGGVALEVLAS